MLCMISAVTLSNNAGAVIFWEFHDSGSRCYKHAAGVLDSQKAPPNKGPPIHDPDCWNERQQYPRTGWPVGQSC